MHFIIEKWFKIFYMVVITSKKLQSVVVRYRKVERYNFIILFKLMYILFVLIVVVVVDVCCRWAAAWLLLMTNCTRDSIVLDWLSRDIPDISSSYLYCWPRCLPPGINKSSIKWILNIYSVQYVAREKQNAL